MCDWRNSRRDARVSGELNQNVLCWASRRIFRCAPISSTEEFASLQFSLHFTTKKYIIIIRNIFYSEISAAFVKVPQNVVRTSCNVLLMFTQRSSNVSATFTQWKVNILILMGKISIQITIFLEKVHWIVINFKNLRIFLLEDEKSFNFYESMNIWKTEITWKN